MAEEPDKSKYNYIEFLKRILREVYRTRSKGLPIPTEHSTDFEEIKLEVKAKNAIYVINVDDVNLSKKEIYKYLEDRLRELYSQGFGFLVFYGSEEKLRNIKNLWYTLPSSGLNITPSFIEIHVDESKKIFTLANLMWGKIEPFLSDVKISLDEHVLTLEDEFYSRIEKIASDWRTALVVEPSGEDEEGLGGESIEHYGIKAFVVKHLIENEGIQQSNIITEHNLGDIIVDVYVRHHKIGDIAVEIETLYGTVLPAIKLRKRIESRLEKGLKVWIVIPNPQFMIYFKEITALRKVYRKKYPDAVEFYTLDIYSKQLISFEKINKILKKEISNH